MIRWLGVLLCASTLLAPRAVLAEDAASYRNASLAYGQGDFIQAVAMYQQLVDAGVSHADLYYNLGNACFRSGQLGRAIANYERALRLEPQASDARYNAEVAREAVADKVANRLSGAEVNPLWMRTVTKLSTAELTLAFLLLDFLFFAALVVVRFLVPGLIRTAAIVGSAFAGVSLLLIGLLLAGNIWFLTQIEMGVVLPDQVLMREGADNTTGERAPVHAGLVVRIVERRAGWLHIRLANGNEGWVQVAHIGELR